MVAQRWLPSLLVVFAIAVLAATPYAQTPPGNPGAPAGKSGDLEHVQRLLAARREYQKSLEQLYVYYHQVGDKERERKFQVPDLLKSEFAAKYRVIDIDGIRVEFGDGWGLVRASNTQPVLVVRFEARTEKRLAEIRDTMMGALKRVGVEDAPVAH